MRSNTNTHTNNFLCLQILPKPLAHALARWHVRTALCAVRRVAARAAEKASPKLDINKLDINEITATLAEKWDETENKSTVVTYVAGGVVGA